MSTREEVLKFVSACEVIQILLAGGVRLNEDERRLVEMEANELLVVLGPGEAGARLRLV